MKRILICEDNEDLAGLFTMALDNARYHIQVLHSAEGIVDEVERFRPDVILMDLRMPGVNGAEAIEALRANAATAGVQVILVSANAHVAAVARQLRVPYLAKPFDLAEFRIKVAEAVERSGRSYTRELGLGGPGL